jgi:hypothetical protein
MSHDILDTAYNNICLYVAFCAGRLLMSHPEGRVLAVQQQMFFAHILSDNWGIDEAIILRKLAMSGLKLAPDAEEVAVDAAAILPKLSAERPKQAKLKAVPSGEEI